MIVRILGEGRYDVPDADLPAIEQLDAQLVDAMDRGDEAAFARYRTDLAAKLKVNHRALEFFRLERLPVNGSGKIDYQALAGAR